MQNSLLNLSLDHWGVFLLFIIPALLDIGIFVYVFFFLPSNKINNAFSAFVLLLGIAQALDGLMRISASAETAMEWAKISGAPWVFMLPFQVLFTLRYTGWNKKIPNALLLTLLFFPAIIFELFITAGLGEVTIIKSETWNWIPNPKNTIITNVLYLWIVIISFISFILYWLYYIKVRKDSTKKTFSLLIAAGNTVPFIVGIMTEAVFPIVFKINDIPLATPAIAVFSVSILIAITKYKILEFSPKHQLDNILQTMNEGLVIVNLKGEIMYVNNMFCKEMGYKLNELLGKIAQGLLIKEEEEIEKLEQGIKERIEKKSGQYEVLTTTKTGEKKWIMLNATPYLDENGNVIGSLIIITNINELKSANKDLELFIYKASHDLRGPLASILGLSGLIKNEKDSKEIMKYLDMIDVSAKKLDTILVTLIKSMKIRDAKNLNEEVNIETLLNEVIERFIGYEGFSRLEIIKNISVRGDILSSKLILETVFQNMIENAIKYQNPEVVNSYLKVNITETEKKVEIIFEDNGIGIDPAAIPKIFDMYFRGSSKVKGTGLGLYLVKNGIEKLNGTIKVESEQGKGTKFIISLPQQLYNQIM